MKGFQALLRGVLLLAALAMMLVHANEAFKIGFVDLDRILRESGPAIKALKKLEKEFSGRDADIKKMAEQLRGKQQELDKGGLTMAEADRRSREREIVRIQQDLTRLQREMREDYNVRRNEELAGIQERVYNTIKQIASADKYDVILQDAVYYNPKLDVTDKVLKALVDK